QVVGCTAIFVGGVIIWVATNDTDIDVIEGHNAWTRAIWMLIWELHKKGTVLSTSGTDEDGEPENPDVSDTPSVPTPPAGGDGDDEGTTHGKKRIEEAKSDPNRQVGDPNRIIREGKQYYDTETGATAHVGRHGRTVFRGDRGEITRATYTKKQIEARVLSGKWKPL
ncbi:MAG: hypothetical protein KAR22_09370, partial [Gammaproteobacteria bacterium]|nr:hypothetical protein [Gammaproteobacteria bacterium]